MLERITSPDGVGYYVSPLLARAGVQHAFSTRVGGVSPPPFDSLNLGNPAGRDARDDDGRIAENYRRLQAAIGCADVERCWVHQVHGGDVAIVRRGTPFTSGAAADGLMSDDPARVLAVRAADCVPVLVATADGRRVAAVHAGWRGVIARAVPNAVAALAALPGAPPAAASDLVAAIGPCVSGPAFEIGPEVLETFAAAFGPGAPLARDGDAGKGHVDLREALRLQLLALGLAADRIDTTDRCSVRHPGEFFSHRRDHGVTGRMAALIAARGP